MSCFTHFSQALLLKSRIADCQNLVDNQNLRLEMGRYSKSQAHIHTGRIPLYRRIQELGDLCEIHNLIELPLDFRSLHPKDCAVQINVLTPGKLRMEPCSDLQE